MDTVKSSWKSQNRAVLVVSRSATAVAFFGSGWILYPASARAEPTIVLSNNVTNPASSFEWAANGETANADTATIVPLSSFLPTLQATLDAQGFTQANNWDVDPNAVTLANNATFDIETYSLSLNPAQSGFQESTEFGLNAFPAVPTNVPAGSITTPYWLQILNEDQRYDDFGFAISTQGQGGFWQADNLDISGGPASATGPSPYYPTSAGFRLPPSFYDEPANYAGGGTYLHFTTFPAWNVFTPAAGGQPATDTIDIANYGITWGFSIAGPLMVGCNGSSGTLQLGSSSGLVTGICISGNSALDLTNDHLIISYGSGPDPIASIAALIKAGYNGGAWNGEGGIISSAAAENPGYGLGYADSADPGNPAVLASGTIEIKYTLLGDATLSGVVNGTDFGILAANFNKGVGNWDQGDFNYDGVVNGTDFADLAANFNKGASGEDIGPGPLSDPALVAFAEANGLMADVPEPASMTLLTVGTIAALARRRRQLP